MYNLSPTLTETLYFIKQGALAVTKDEAKQHLENLLYMKSVLYWDDKNNPKHISRVNSVLACVEKEYSKEIHEARQGERKVHLVAQILAANKIVDQAIHRLQTIMERDDEHHIHSPVVEKIVPTIIKIQEKSSLPAIEPAEKPKLRETLSFLLSVVSGVMKKDNKIPLHLVNLEKISKLISKKQEDAALQRLRNTIMEILVKIYGVQDEKEIKRLLDKNIQVLKNLEN